jgi:leucyl aminopeptidase
MAEQPSFQPLRISQTSRPPTRQVLEAIDHMAIAVPQKPGHDIFRAIPQGSQIKKLLDSASRNGISHVTTRLANTRATAITVAKAEPGSAFRSLTWARELLARCLDDGTRTLGIEIAGFDDDARDELLGALVAAAQAAAFKLPSFKSKAKPGTSLRSLKIFGAVRALALDESRAEALGNNIARWFTALPPNELTARTYREAIRKLASEYGLGYEFLDERRLRRLGAGAFLAVAQGNANRDAGIVRLKYRPSARAKAELALVGKGVIFDTGGTNLKPFKGMLDMHTDMQGSAVALGTLIALAASKAPYGVDAWLALTENRLSPAAYKSQDIVRTANGTTIQVIHTDAEGRMILADTLALAAREKPAFLIDYATLTGACVTALTERYSGIFSNRGAANELLRKTGELCGERVWPFPMDTDFDEALRSDIADIKQCAVDGYGDHILAARFLSRFVPASIPWVHVDLSAGQHKGGLAHIPTEITGFGVRLTLALLGHDRNPGELAKLVSA